MTWVSIDIGLSGSISLWKDKTLIEIIDMPVTKIETKKAQYVYKNSNPKIVIKTGANKGERPKKLKSAAKYKTTLDVCSIYTYLNDKKVEYGVIEDIGFTVGNSSKTLKTTAFNFGSIIAVFKILEIPHKLIRPHLWKKDLSLGKDKLETIEFVEELYPEFSFRTKRGALLDGHADSVAIGYWHTQNT
jgi:hypothetical protein